VKLIIVVLTTNNYVTFRICICEMTSTKPQYRDEIQNQTHTETN